MSVTHIEIASIVSAATHEGMVEFCINGERQIWTLDKAREIRGLLDGAIEAAVSDSLLVRFLMEHASLTLEAAVGELRIFREMRQGSAGTVYPQ